MWLASTDSSLRGGGPHPCGRSLLRVRLAAAAVAVATVATGSVLCLLVRALSTLKHRYITCCAHDILVLNGNFISRTRAQKNPLVLEMGAKPERIANFSSDSGNIFILEKKIPFPKVSNNTGGTHKDLCAPEICLSEHEIA